MNKDFRVLAVVLGVVAIVGQLLAGAARASEQVQPEAMEVVQRDVRQALEAFYAGDVDTVVMLTFPAVSQAAGGVESLRATMQTAMYQIRRLGIKLDSLTFPEAPRFVQTRDHEYVVVPTRTVLSSGTQRVENYGFQFGIRDLDSRQWTYLDGVRLSEGVVHEMFPDFPTGFRFPTVSKKRL